MDARIDPHTPPHSGTAATLVDVILGGRDVATTRSLDEILCDALRAIRLHFGMDVAFVAEFAHGRRIFRQIDTHLDNPPIHVGSSDPLDESYCQRVVDGRLPELIRDAGLIPAALELPATLALPVGAHLSVPIRLKNGTLFGTFCCFSFAADRSLQARDLAMMRAFAEFSGTQIERHLAIARAHDDARERIQAILSSGGLSCLFQPVHHLGQARIVGAEALSRFSAHPMQTPDALFKEAMRVGLGEEVEMAAVHTALRALERLPPSLYLALNVSPAHILSGALRSAFAGLPLNRLVIEVTEHAAIDDYVQLVATLAPLRAQGLRLAIDDAGAGYASFRHILKLRPDMIKLDISITRDIDSDPTRQALAAALIRFAQETGSVIVAEGVETDAELAALRRLGVDKVQGYLIGRPMPLEAMLTPVDSTH